jgi:hypothetical protein
MLTPDVPPTLALADRPRVSWGRVLPLASCISAGWRCAREPGPKYKAHRKLCKPADTHMDTSDPYRVALMFADFDEPCHRLTRHVSLLEIEITRARMANARSEGLVV